MHRFLFVVAQMLVICVTAAAQLPQVTIHTSAGNHVAVWGQGGTVQQPYPIGGGFHSIDLPDGMGILIVGNGNDLAFQRITTDHYVVMTEGSQPMPGPGDGVDYIPNDPNAYRRGTSHELLSFEAIPVMFAHDAWLPPDQSTIGMVMTQLTQTTHLMSIMQEPRLVRLLQNFDDKNLPVTTPFGMTDMGWLTRNWNVTFGGPQHVGWYDAVCTRGSGGFDNWHYDGLLWLALHYLADPNFDRYRFGVQQAVAQACYGRTWTGPYAGFSRYEKGNDFIGEGYSAHAWEKQWSAGLIVWYRLTGNPILGMQVDLMREQLLLSDPNTVWQGYWGARIGARYLEELLAHYLNDREEWVAQKAKLFIQNCKAWQLPGGAWPNLGNGGAAEESPWMQAQLVSAIFRWLEQRPDFQSAMTYQEATAAGAAVWNLGSTRSFGNKPLLKYRFITTDVPPASMHITAFAVPMLRFMAAIDPAAWGPLAAEVETFVNDFAGTSLGGIVAGTPVPISDLGYRFPPEGSGWSKSMRFYLEGAR